MAASMPSPAQTPPPATRNAPSSFDIYESYLQHLRGPPALPPNLAAIQALTSSLKADTNLTTLSEAIALLSELNATLKARLRNPLPAAAGTDAFLHSLATSTARPTQPPQPTTATASSESAEKTTHQVLDAAQRTVDAALHAHRKITALAPRLVRPGAIVVLPPPPPHDTLLHDFLLAAADADISFKALFIDPASTRQQRATSDLRASLHKRRTPTLTISAAALAHTLSQLVSVSGGASVMLVCAASALLADGAVLAPMGTQQAFMVGKEFGVERYALCETGRGVRVLSLPGEELASGSGGGARLPWTLGDEAAQTDGGRGGEADSGEEEACMEQVDVTPPSYVTSIITERGPLPPSALSEESIKFWF